MSHSREKKFADVVWPGEVKVLVLTDGTSVITLGSPDHPVLQAEVKAFAECLAKARRARVDTVVYAVPKEKKTKRCPKK